jgi:class 3 adenylate cyclase
VGPEETSHRTWLCSVLFLDVVNFSNQSVTEQMAMKEHLNEIIASALEHVPDSNRIMLDTGDGAALCFTGDPEDALFAALHLRDALREEAANGPSVFALRMGINLGPAKLMRDVNGRQNVIGDGINAAQRVMSFAAPNQILVSRSYYEVIACLSDEYASLFHYQGQRQDKHVRQYTVYEVSVANDQASLPAGAVEISNQAVEKPEPTTTSDVRPEVSTGPGAPTKSWEPDELERVERALAAHLGPVAKVLVRRAAQRTTRIEALYQVLASEIVDPVAREAFLSHAAQSVSRDRPSSGSTPAEQPVAPASEWDQDALKTAEVALAAYVGPVAKVLVKRAARLSSGLEDLYQRLAADLPSDAQRNAFLRAVWKR